MNKLRKHIFSLTLIDKVSLNLIGEVLEIRFFESSPCFLFYNQYFIYFNYQFSVAALAWC